MEGAHLLSDLFVGMDLTFHKHQEQVVGNNQVISKTEYLGCEVDQRDHLEVKHWCCFFGQRWYRFHSYPLILKYYIPLV